MSDPATENRRRAYLKALNIDVYALRGQAAPENVEIGAAEIVQSSVAEDVVTDLNDWTALEKAVPACTKCVLHKTRNQTVLALEVGMLIG